MFTGSTSARFVDAPCLCIASTLLLAAELIAIRLLSDVQCLSLFILSLANILQTGLYCLVRRLVGTGPPQNVAQHPAKPFRLKRLS